MPRELRALRRRHVLSCAGSSAEPAHALSARVPAPAQTLASVATQGRCGGEEQQGVAVGVVVGKGCLKRLRAVASGGGSGAAKKVSFASEPQVRVISPPAVVEATARRRGRGTLTSAEVGGEESLHPRPVRFGGGYSTAPVRRSMRNAANLGVEVEQVTVAVCNSVKFEEGGDAGETVDRKRKRNVRQNSEHMFVSAQIGVSRRSTRSSCLLLEAPFVPPPVVEKKRARSKEPDVKEQTLAEQPAKVQDSGSTLNSEFATIDDAFAQSKRNRRKVQEDEPAAQKYANEETSGRTTRSSSRAAAVMLPLVVENIRTRKTEGAHSDRELPKVLEVPEKDAPVLGGLRSRAVQGKNSVEEENHFVKKLENRRQPTKPATCNSSYEEQMVQTVVRKGCLKRSGADMSSRSSGVAKKVTFKLVGQPAAEVAGFRRRLRVAADGEGGAGEAGSTAPLRLSRRNVVNVGAGDRVKRIAGAVSRNISAKAHEKEEDVGEAVDRKRKARENAENIGTFLDSGDDS